ncbi:LPXTG cell wall anchor domain-containing protein [Embleya sp. NBC_00888]
MSAALPGTDGSAQTPALVVGAAGLVLLLTTTIVLTRRRRPTA